jgi:mono/diheme cytochrome c family protein
VLGLTKGPRRGWAWPAAIAVALTGVVALSGCDLQEDADLDRGRELFTARCGTCHSLAEAGTTATIGPDLDAAFAEARSRGMDSDTIEGVVQSQIANPREVDPELAQTNPELYNRVYMPADLVTGSDAEDVGAYVASVAGIPGIMPPQVPGPPGAQVFADNGCGGCHTLEAAGTGGTLGPDLDDALPGMRASEIEESIVDPSARIAQGFTDAMPKEYGTTIPTDDLAALVKYLTQCAGNGDEPTCTGEGQ